MKYVRKALCCILIVAICMSFAIPTFAKTVTSPTYGSVTGTSRRVPNDAVRVTTSVSSNPDNATLRNSVEFSYGSTLAPMRSANSSAGAKSFVYDFEMMSTIDNPYVYAFCGHEVYRSLSDAVYFQTEVNLS